MGTGWPALFLDRDGVVNVDHGYVCRPEDFQFIDGIFDLCRAAQRQGYLIVVITNQAGIGRGYYSEADFAALTAWMVERFREEGVAIAGVYFCPFHPEHGIGPYKADAPCRKPNPGMILQAAEEHGIDLARSVLVGDKPSDIAAGVAAGVGRRYLYRPSAQERDEPADAVVVDHLALVADQLAAADEASR
jgi:D-glycero-D-manno-heptose 1,7-bisphosphate phosphatase